MVADAELLRRYTEDGSEESFAELVNRHLRLVYVGALRRTSGDCHLAADISQTVFVQLASNAHSLRRHTELEAWLFAATRNAAINACVAEQRRRKREQEAFIMQQSLADQNQPAVWERLRPVLHEALDTLPERDRAAVLQRFFYGRPFAEIGRALSLTEEAARKRVDRALEKLHGVLSRRGITSTIAALSAVLTAEAALPAPASLTQTIVSAVAANATASAASSGVLSFIVMSKIKLGVIGAIAAAGLVTVLVQFQTTRALSAELKAVNGGVRQFIALRTENEILRNQIGKVTTRVKSEELARIHNRIAALKSRPPGVEETKMLPVSKMRNAGWSTPEAAFETLTWAQVQDPDTYLDTFARSFAFDPDTKVKADAFFATLSPEVRGKYRTPERLVVPIIFGDGIGLLNDPIVAVQILDQRNHDNDPDFIDLRWWQESASGKGFEGTMRLTRRGDEWLQGRRHPMSDQNWQKFISRIDPATGAVVPEKKMNPANAVPMISKSFTFTVAAAVGIFGATSLALRHYNAGIRGRVAERAGPGRNVIALQEENRHLKQLVGQLSRDGTAAETAVQNELVRARTELRELERRLPAVDVRAQASAELAANRNPETGPMRIEHFQNVGRATPSAAFQTLPWGATTGADDALTESVAISSGARQKLEALIAGFSEETRLKYQTPEKLVSLFITADILKSSSVQIKGQSIENTQRAALRVRIGERDRDTEIPLQLDAGGWRLVVSEGQVDKLVARLRGSPVGR